MDMKALSDDVIASLAALKPDKIVLFGSYASGEAKEGSDVDLFLVKKGLRKEEVRDYEKEAARRLIGLVRKYKVGFDVLSAPFSALTERDDHFIRVDILQHGKVLYERNGG